MGAYKRTGMSLEKNKLGKLLYGLGSTTGFNIRTPYFRLTLGYTDSRKGFRAEWICTFDVEHRRKNALATQEVRSVPVKEGEIGFMFWGLVWTMLGYREFPLLDAFIRIPKCVAKPKDWDTEDEWEFGRIVPRLNVDYEVFEEAYMAAWRVYSKDMPLLLSYFEYELRCLFSDVVQIGVPVSDGLVPYEGSFKAVKFPGKPRCKWFFCAHSSVWASLLEGVVVITNEFFYYDSELDNCSLPVDGPVPFFEWVGPNIKGKLYDYMLDSWRSERCWPRISRPSCMEEVTPPSQGRKPIRYIFVDDGLVVPGKVQHYYKSVPENKQ